MTIHVEIPKLWCGQMVRCNDCGYEFTSIHHRGIPIIDLTCKNCGHRCFNIETLERPWRGTIEVEIDDERS